MCNMLCLHIVLPATQVFCNTRFAVLLCTLGKIPLALGFTSAAVACRHTSWAAMGGGGEGETDKYMHLYTFSR